MNTAILWEGPSRINGAPIVVLATGLQSTSANEKTGDMVQTWILLQDEAPNEAVKSGADAGICGGCPQRGSGDGSDRTCYVVTHQAPLSVWRKYKRGGYARVEEGRGLLVAGRFVRLGSYGDPAAVPAHVWRDLLTHAAGWTGYSHQWRAPRLRDVMEWCQASCETSADVAHAAALGFGTFRVRPLTETGALAAAEMACPASAEEGFRATCAECRACSGSGAGTLRHVAIYAHGYRAKMYSGERKRRTELVQLRAAPAPVS